MISVCYLECFSDREALVIRVSASPKRNSCLHLVFHSVNTDAPNVVENRSPHNMLFRKAGSYGAQWQLARPWSSVPVAWDTIQKEQRKVYIPFPLLVAYPNHFLFLDNV